MARRQPPRSEVVPSTTNEVTIRNKQADGRLQKTKVRPCEAIITWNIFQEPNQKPIPIPSPNIYHTALSPRFLSHSRATGLLQTSHTTPYHRSPIFTTLTHPATSPPWMNFFHHPQPSASHLHPSPPPAPQRPLILDIGGMSIALAKTTIPLNTSCKIAPKLVSCWIRALKDRKRLLWSMHAFF